jgi:hypothetical protein
LLGSSGEDYTTWRLQVQFGRWTGDFGDRRFLKRSQAARSALPGVLDVTIDRGRELVADNSSIAPATKILEKLIMIEIQNSQLKQKVEVARKLVDHLISIAADIESEEWLEKFRATQKALVEGRLRDAIRAEAKLISDKLQPVWVTSFDLSKMIEQAMGAVTRQLHFPGHSERPYIIGELPATLAEAGTIAEETERVFQALIATVKRDPHDDDPDYSPLMQAVDERVRLELEAEGRYGGFGSYHMIMWKKKQILWEEYGIDWKTLAELNPHIIID